MTRTARAVVAVDLFCGAGGLTAGLRAAGINVAAGIDIDRCAKFAYEANNAGTAFRAWDLRSARPGKVKELFPPGIKLLAGCAPCQPFSKLTNGADTHESWGLLGDFARLVKSIKPDLVTMENVPELVTRGSSVFTEFVMLLKANEYYVDHKVVDCRDFGIPQARKRLVLVASRLGEINVPVGGTSKKKWKTVRDAIGRLPNLAAGKTSPTDRFHVAARLNDTNLARLAATPKDGGTSKDWPEELKLACHKKPSGKKYVTIYGRMAWDDCAPTMTTLCNGLGNGRFGHPVQDRAISLREAAILQSFSPTYSFWPADKKVQTKAVARLIGNAVPPKLGQAIGAALVEHVEKMQSLNMRRRKNR